MGPNDINQVIPQYFFGNCDSQSSVIKKCDNFVPSILTCHLKFIDYSVQYNSVTKEEKMFIDCLKTKMIKRLMEEISMSVITYE